MNTPNVPGLTCYWMWDKARQLRVKLMGLFSICSAFRYPTIDDPFRWLKHFLMDYTELFFALFVLT